MCIYDIIHELEKLKEFVRGAYLATNVENGCIEEILYIIGDDIDTLIGKLTKIPVGFASND